LYWHLLPPPPERGAQLDRSHAVAPAPRAGDRARPL
jgi:hypothetical protein